MPGSAVTKLSICASVMTSGGASRMTSGAAALTRNPASRAAASASLARGAVSTTPHSSPRPRMWSTSGWPSDSMPWRNDLPNTSARRTRSSAASTRSTARAAAVQTGLPPKVLPCRPGVNSSAAGPTARHAPIGSPPPSPLARVTTSGVMPSCWWAKKAPVRPIPVCTSSSTSRAPCRAVISRAADQVARGRDDDAALPHDRLQEHRGGVVVDGGGQRVGVAVRHVGDVAGQRLERRLLGRLTGQRQRAHRAAVEAPLARQRVSCGR